MVFILQSHFSLPKNIFSDHGTKKRYALLSNLATNWSFEKERGHTQQPTGRFQQKKGLLKGNLLGNSAAAIILSLLPLRASLLFSWLHLK